MKIICIDDEGNELDVRITCLNCLSHVIPEIATIYKDKVILKATVSGCGCEDEGKSSQSYIPF